MTKTPQEPFELKPDYKTPYELEVLFVEHGFEAILAGCDQRTFASASFPMGKATHPSTVQEHGVVYCDKSGIRAVIIHYKHSGETWVRSIKRLVDATGDYRIQMPPASDIEQSRGH